MGKPAASFSQWQSPATSNLLEGRCAALCQPSVAPSGQVHWLELRPSEQGRVVLATRDSSGVVTVSPVVQSGIDLKPQERQFGGVPAHPGTSYAVVGEDVYFVNHKDQGLYRQKLADPAAGATLLTRSNNQLKFSELTWDGLRQRIVCVAQDQSPTSEPCSTISAIDVKTGAVTVLARGSNCYMSPALDPTGTKLAWVQWNHPNMPWDATELCVADVLNGGTVISAKVVAGGGEEAVQQPVWGLDGSLYFLSDKTGRWSLYKYMRRGETIPLLAEDHDIGVVPWPMGRNSYYPLPTGKLLVIHRPSSHATTEALGLLDPEKGELTPLNTGLDSFGATLAVRHIQTTSQWKIALVSTSSAQSSKVVSLEVTGLDQLAATTPADWQTVQVASEAQAPTPTLSTSQTPGPYPQYYPMMYFNPVMAAAYQAAYAAAFAATASLQQRQNSQGNAPSPATTGLPPAQSPYAMLYPHAHGQGAYPPNVAAPNNQAQQPQPMYAAYPYMAVAPYQVGFVPFGMPHNPYAGYHQFQMQPPQQQQQQQQPPPHPQGFPGFQGYQGFQGFPPQLRPDPNRPNARFMFPDGARYRRRVFSFRISLRSLLQFIVFGIIFYKNVLQHISWIRFTVLLLGGLILFLTSHYAPLRRFISSIGNTTHPDPNNPRPQVPQRRGFLSEIAVFVVGFVASLIPAWNYNAQDAAAFQAAQDMFADEDENRDNNRNREQGGAEGGAGGEAGAGAGAGAQPGEGNN